MNLVYPAKNVSQFATEELIENSINTLNQDCGSFLILEKDQMTYMQVLSTEHGFIVQFQEGSIGSHFELSTYLSRPKTIDLLKKYAQSVERDNWCSGLQYHKVNVQGFWGSLGYKLGLVYGKILKGFKYRRDF